MKKHTRGPDLTVIAQRRAAGESLADLATEIGWSWQKLEKRLRHGGNGVPPPPRPARRHKPARQARGHRILANAANAVTAQPNAFYDGLDHSKAWVGVFGQTVYDSDTGRQRALFEQWASDPAKPEGVALTEKYRPRTLDHVLGQDEAVRTLRAFVRDPKSSGFIFEGDTGTGKTSAAKALAHDLGCAVEAMEMGGLEEIASGELTADAVRDCARRMRNIPFYGSGWKLIVCNEADRMSPQAEAVWLDVLEALPPRVLVIFTTNHAGRLSQRLRDRCERVRFTSDPHKTAGAIRDLVGMIWKSETGMDEFHPIAEEIAQAVVDEDGAASFRRAVQWVSRLVRDASVDPNAGAEAHDFEHTFPLPTEDAQRNGVLTGEGDATPEGSASIHRETQAALLCDLESLATLEDAQRRGGGDLRAQWRAMWRSCPGGAA
jgi:MoxR-like ATPase